MTSSSLSAAMLVLVRLLPLGAGGELAAEHRKAEGTWHVTAMIMNGEEIPTEGIQGLKIVLTGQAVKAVQGEGAIAEGTYKVVGVNGKSVEFDLTMSVGPDKGKTFPALNEWLSANEIRTTIAQPGKPRPKPGVMAEKGDRQAVFVIRREKR